MTIAIKHNLVHGSHLTLIWL